MSREDRNAARGQRCTLRISGYGKCASPETTVLCHAPSRDKGMGLKSPDWWGAFGCSRCHDLIDRRSPGLTQAQIDAAWLRGIFETIKIRREENPYLDLPF